jgi:hypothetical protein
MLFFQMLLFAGYAYAHLTATRLRPGVQAVLHVVLLLAAAVALPILPVADFAGCRLEADRCGTANAAHSVVAIGFGGPAFLCVVDDRPVGAIVVWKNASRLFAVSTLRALECRFAAGVDFVSVCRRTNLTDVVTVVIVVDGVSRLCRMLRAGRVGHATSAK